jgi:ring-1,2-phenylacetyl-CoA epoxidase subunit PaaC
MPADARYAYVASLGDDALVLGQRLGEWCGHAPTLELDLSLANLGLDLIGQADHLLGYAAELEGAGRSADDLAFRRDVLAFRNCLLVEQPNGDFARTLARHLLFSTWQKLSFERMTALDDDRLAAIAAKAVKEVAYHVRFASEWVIRLGDGTEESRRRMIEGLAWSWRFVDELFETPEALPELVDKGLAVDPASLRQDWDRAIDLVLAEAGLTRPEQKRGVSGGRSGRHTEHLGHMLSEMQFLPRAYPDAVW